MSKKKSKKTPPQKLPLECPSCGVPQMEEGEQVCLLCDLFGPGKVPEPIGPPPPLPVWGQVVDLNAYKASRGLPVYLGGDVDTPHHAAAFLTDMHGNPLH